MTLLNIKKEGRNVNQLCELQRSNFLLPQEVTPHIPQGFSRSLVPGGEAEGTKLQEPIPPLYIKKSITHQD